MKKIFALSLLLSSPLFAMIHYPSSQKPKASKGLAGDEITTYLEMVRNAAASGHLDRLKLLKTVNERQFDVFLNLSNALGATSLYYACQNGHTEVVKYLLEEDALPSQELLLGASDKEKIPCTPLHIAAAEGHLEIVKLLINANDAIINSQHAPKKRTPLHYAIANGHTEVTAVLLNKRASDEIKDTDGNTPISLAAKREYNLAPTEAFSKSDLIRAAALGQLKDISMFIALKVNLEETDFKTCSTPLIWAANCGHARAVQLLLDAGANINAKSKDGLTALDSSKQRNHFEVVAVLEEALKKAQDANDKGKPEATK